MLGNTIANMADYRRAKSNERLLQALERYRDVVQCFENEQGDMDAGELETFLLQALGEHLTSQLDDASELWKLDENYRRFDARLRHCLRIKLKSMRHFEGVRF